jgi:hypothetical protein
MWYIRKNKSSKAKLLYFLSGFGGLLDSILCILTLGKVVSGYGLNFSEAAMIEEIKHKKLKV